MTRVLVTGAGGFIGSHLTERCVQLGYDVRAFVRYNSENRWGWLEHSPHKHDVDVVSGDIRDFDSVKSAMAGRDIVFHLAALIGIPYSYHSPLAYIRTNIEGTYNILQAARELDVGNILITSTSETYGSAQYVPIDEAHPAVGQSPYSATKIAADQLALSFHRSFDLPVRIVRPFNTYGPRQSARAIIPTLIAQMLNNQRKIKAGNLAPTRDLTYVQDTVEGFIAISQSPALVGTATNIGMNEEISIGDLARLIAEIIGVAVEIDVEKGRLRPDKSEVMRLRCNNEKITRSTSWQPHYALRSGLEATIAWMSEHVSGYKSGNYNV
ncbi:GDP-mannose 4,6-dehydratase [candidate division KSB1 bacterium]|nr:GDP-mannose 4,6-dehydratase [candidate division KSB1 bacterium]